MSAAAPTDPAQPGAAASPGRSGAGLRRPLQRVAAALGALALLPLLWGFCVEPGLLRTRAYEFELPRWPAACAGLRLAVLGDLHVGSPHNGLANLRRVVELTERGHPDLVLITGDLVIQGILGGHFVPPEAIAPELAQLRAPLGSWAVLGNHDRQLGAARMRSALEAAGIHVLEDAAAPLGRGTCSFWLAGISDFRTASHNVTRALHAIPDDEGTAVLAFTHNPDVFPDLPDRVALTVAGHTHGGQVYLPLLGRPILPSIYGARYAIGPISEHGRQLFVTPGIGTSLIPVRFLVPPEISFLTLFPSAAAPTQARLGPPWTRRSSATRVQRSRAGGADRVLAPASPVHPRHFGGARATDL